MPEAAATRASAAGLLLAAGLFLTTFPSLAASRSYVVLQDSETDSLISISADGRIVKTIANHAAGVDLAVGRDGNYIVAARSKLLRVTPGGAVSTIAEAPPDSSWTAIALDTLGNIIAADGTEPAVWRVSADGHSIAKVATYHDIRYPKDHPREMALVIDDSGDYLLLARWNGRFGATSCLLRVTPAGALTETPVPTLLGPMKMVPDGSGGFLVTDNMKEEAVFRFRQGGVPVPLTHGFRQPGHRWSGLARDTETGDVLFLDYLDGGGAVFRAAGDSSPVSRWVTGLTRPRAILFEQHDIAPQAQDR
jgi:hypothetical protein